MRTRLATIAGLVAVLVAISLTLSGAASTAAPKIPHFTLWVYAMKVGTKGALTYDGHYYPPSNPADASYGDVRDEHFVGSFSVDTTMRNLVFAKGHARGVRNSLGDTEPAVLNGTWTDGGTMFIDDRGDTKPFSCSGKVGTSVPTVSAVLNIKTTASTLNFKLEIPPDELTSHSECADTNGIQGGMSYANNLAYTTTFSISRSQLGRKTITKQISGPLHSLHWHQYECGQQCSFNLAWHGVVKLTLSRVIRQ
jgi:hypothetical protein